MKSDLEITLGFSMIVMILSIKIGAIVKRQNMLTKQT